MFKTKTKYIKAQISTRTVTFLAAEPQFRRHSSIHSAILWNLCVKTSPLPVLPTTCLLQHHLLILLPLISGDHRTLSSFACTSESSYAFLRLSCIYSSIYKFALTHPSPTSAQQSKEIDLLRIMEMNGEI